MDDRLTIYRTDVVSAMDEYAKEVAIDYAHWLLKRIFPYFLKDDPIPEATKLFDIYLQETNKL